LTDSWHLQRAHRVQGGLAQQVVLVVVADEVVEASLE